MRLDAIARFLQDAAYDDVTDGGLDEPAWVVRRTRVQVQAFPRYLEPVDVATFCWSLGSRYAERRTTLAGTQGGTVDTLTLWVRLDPDTGRPTELSEAFRELFHEAAGGRRTRPKLELPETPSRAEVRPWPVRHSDLDMLGHVNNTVYWTVLEELLAEDPHPDAPRDFEMEFRAPIGRDAEPRLRQRRDGETRWAWLTSGARTHAAGVIWPPQTRSESPSV